MHFRGSEGGVLGANQCPPQIYMLKPWHQASQNVIAFDNACREIPGKGTRRWKTMWGQWEGGHLQVKERVLKRIQGCWHPGLTFQPPALWESKFLLLRSHSKYAGLSLALLFIGSAFKILMEMLTLHSVASPHHDDPGENLTTKSFPEIVVQN